MAKTPGETILLNLELSGRMLEFTERQRVLRLPHLLSEAVALQEGRQHTVRLQGGPDPASSRRMYSRSELPTVDKASDSHESPPWIMRERRDSELDLHRVLYA